MTSATPGEPKEASPERLILLSDAVVAIAMTLLALDLPVPTGSTASAFWTSTRHGSDRYLAFLVSFAVIAAAWRIHNQILRLVRRSDGRLETINFIWLLTIILVPFATKLLTSTRHDSLVVHAIRFSWYALVEVVSNVAIIGMVRHVAALSHQDSGDPPDMAGVIHQSRAVVAGFGLSIPVFFATSYGWVLWFAGPIILHLGRQLARRAGWWRPSGDLL